MNRIASGWFVLLVVSIAATVSAQSDTVFIKKFRLHLKNGEKVSGNNGVITPQEFTGFSIYRGNLKYQSADILCIERKSGTIGAPLAVVGALGGIAVALITKTDKKTLLYEPDDTDAAPRLFGYTAAGFLVGFGIGSLIPKWEIVNMPVRAEVTGTTGAFGAKLSFRF